MSSISDEVRALAWQGFELELGPARSALFERAVALADTGDDLPLRVEVRAELARSYLHGGEPAKALAPFAWAWREAERNPGALSYDTMRVLKWHYKGLVGTLINHPEFSLDQIERLLDEMESVYRKAGNSMQAVHAHRFLFLDHLGDREGAAREFDAWTTSPRDDLSDCLACDVVDRVRWLSQVGRDVETIAPAEQVLVDGAGCSEQPRVMLAAMLLPYLRSGQSSRAVAAHRRGYRLSREDRNNVQVIAEHLRFCALTGNSGRGLELLERHLSWLDLADTPYTRLQLLAAGARLLVEVCAQERPDLPVRGPEGETTASDLRDRLTSEARLLAHEFDERNGSTAVSERIDDVIREPRIVDQLNLGWRR